VEIALPRASLPLAWGSNAHEHDLYALLADASALAGDRERLHRYTPLLEGLAARDEHDLYQAVAHRAWGIAHRLGLDFPAAEGRLRLALDLLEALDSRWQFGRTCFELGQVALARQDWSTAQNWLGRALSEFELLRARPDAERTRAALAALA
jgi:hypothetical protein